MYMSSFHSLTITDDSRSLQKYSLSLSSSLKLIIRIKSLSFSVLLSMTVAGEPTADDEEGGHSDEEQEALVKEQEEKSWRLPRPRRCHGRHDQGQWTSRSR